MSIYKIWYACPRNKPAVPSLNKGILWIQKKTHKTTKSSACIYKVKEWSRYKLKQPAAVHSIQIKGHAPYAENNQR